MLSANPAHATNGPVKILIVEDEEQMARLLRRGLQEEGHQLDLCPTADSASQQALDISYERVNSEENAT